MKGLYYRECECRSEGQTNVDSECTPSGSEKDRARSSSDFARERNEVVMEQDRCELLCLGELYKTPCDRGQYMELGHQAKDRYD